MTETTSRDDSRSRLRVFAGLAAMAFVVTLAIVAGDRLSGEGLALYCPVQDSGVLVGVVIGMGTTILVTLFVVAAGRRRSRQRRYPPVVVVAPGGATPALLSEIPPLTDAEMAAAEEGYRRGYRDGWIQAVGAMWDLVANRRLTPQAAHDVCWRHWETTLLPWAWDDCSRMVLPPPARGAG
jgi:hypothetical protein